MHFGKVHLQMHTTYPDVEEFAFLRVSVQSWVLHHGFSSTEPVEQSHSQGWGSSEYLQQGNGPGLHTTQPQTFVFEGYWGMSNTTPINRIKSD